MARNVDIVQKLGGKLLELASPARWTGGEYGRLAKANAPLQTVIAFPDLYEIGMSNNALKILYNRINALDGISCDRVFAPAPDFESLLQQENIFLYALDTGIVIKDLDILMFTLSYELGITGALAILQAAGIPLRAAERGGDNPITIAGGPCVANPLPFAPFFDFFWIGEAEDAFFELLEAARDKKAAGAGREELLELFAANPHVWMRGKQNTRRAIDNNFAEREGAAAVFPVPSLRIVQQHAAVEIMRGCPNGCRFCFAGIWYRPMRQKNPALICGEVARYVRAGGYREISLSSLSSGDYTGIDALVAHLNDAYCTQHISFQLPSLHVSTLSLALLEKISRVRKSGLTFAVETPLDAWQLAINKEVTLDSVCSLLLESKKNGYKSAKFYFMIGLRALPPDSSLEDDTLEEDAIIEFIQQAARRSKMTFNINVGVFIPKAHTPFQWAPQLGMEAAQKKLSKIAAAFKKTGHKVSCHDPFISQLEGIIARGDERVAALIEEAFRAGCRLDAWNEYCKRDIWRSILDEHQELIRDLTGAKAHHAPLPWDAIESGTTKVFLQNEWQRSLDEKLSPVCSKNCAEPCGICGKERRVVSVEEGGGWGMGDGGWGKSPLCQSLMLPGYSPIAPATGEPLTSHPPSTTNKNPLSYSKAPLPLIHPPSPIPHPPSSRMLFSYSKNGTGVFLSHLAMIEVFSGAFLRAGLSLAWTEGFNPLPKIDFAAPISVGIAGENEIALADMDGVLSQDDFIRRVNQCLPEGIVVKAAYFFTVPIGKKKHSLPALLWGFAYENGGETDYVAAHEDKAYRARRFPAGNCYDLTRTQVLARADGALDGAHASYFDVYRAFYSVERPFQSEGKA
ncbi:MAG: TIGR03936 family radical SAM-associated protein [Spirochaetaceae bacterium]|jgi:radical SAM superfamily enzyme YgiQ (UPF0313 family)|nr:TIGR03936 family radical SAM-associated protein [Spirochaetaceae bacterium]